MSPPSASRTRPHPQALRAPVGQKRGADGAHRGEAQRRRHQTSSASKPIPARRAATLRCACQAATLAHLRARFDLATHSKTPAARLGSAARKAGSHLRLPRCSSGAVRGARPWLARDRFTAVAIVNVTGALGNGAPLGLNVSPKFSGASANGGMVDCIRAGPVDGPSHLVSGMLAPRFSSSAVQAVCHGRQVDHR